ncbi:MAG: MFS transporter [Opitutales bacterium]|nr:MFS transporter [Opitutales bacterium]
MSAPAPVSDSVWSVLRNPAFRVVWFAALFSNLGSFLHETAAVWTMASLSANPLWVSMMQSALTLPLFLLGVPAGALADQKSPRRVLLRSEPFLGTVAASLALTAWMGWLNGPTLLAFTLLLGVGVAFALPSWQALLPELVRKEEIPNAVALVGLSLNLSRAIGPAIGGLILSFAGPAVCFALNAATFFTIAWVLYRQPAAPRAPRPHAERYFESILAGMRYVRHAPLLVIVLQRMVGFVFPASCALALFAFLARREWDFGPAAFGAFMAAYGLGAVIAASLVPRLRKRLSLRAILACGAAAFALFGILLATLPGGPVMILLAPLGGIGWMLSISTLNPSAHAASAPWVRGRALAFNLLCFQGSIALGALFWGACAAQFGTRPSILTAMGLLAAAALILHRRDFERVKQLDLAPAEDLPPEPDVHFASGTLSPQARIVVSIQYQIDPADAPAFIAAMRPLGVARRRTGASGWELTERTDTPGLYEERFRVASWEEHLRQHDRITRSDAVLRDAAKAFHKAPTPPRVHHWIERWG